MDTHAALVRRIAGLPSLATASDVLEVMNQVDVFQRQARELKALLEEALRDYIDEHGEIELGDKRWYVGKDTSYKPRLPMEEIAAALIEATGGRLASFCALLSSDALKPGACKKALGSRFADLFETVVKPDLKTGEPRRVVKVVDKRFVKANDHQRPINQSADQE